jgi:hypothetical protein
MYDGQPKNISSVRQEMLFKDTNLIGYSVTCHNSSVCLVLNKNARISW